MLKKNLTYLLVGAAFGCLAGWLVYRASGFAPAATAATPPPAAGVAAAGSGEFDTLMAELEALRARLDAAPDDFDALVRIGDLLFRAQIWDQALRFYERAAELQPSADLLTVCGLCLRQLGQPAEAAERFQAARELEPDHWQSLYNIVVVRLDLADYDGAQQALTTLEAERPGEAEVAALRAELERRLQAGGN